MGKGGRRSRLALRLAHAAAVPNAFLHKILETLLKERIDFNAERERVANEAQTIPKVRQGRQDAARQRMDIPARRHGVIAQNAAETQPVEQIPYGNFKLRM